MCKLPNISLKLPGYNLEDKKDLRKTIDYFGNKLSIPANHNFVVTQCDGSVYSCELKPTCGSLFWSFNREGTLEQVAKSDFEGDWRESLVRVSPYRISIRHLVAIILFVIFTIIWISKC